MKKININIFKNQKIKKVLKNKKVIIPILIIAIIIVISIIILKNVSITKVEEILPQEEISEEQLRQTIVSLYFINNETEEIEIEYRLIDVKELINKPYETLIELLANGPQSEELKTYIPTGTCISNISLENNELSIEFSQEFYQLYEQEEHIVNKTVQTIEKTLTELIEIEKIKIIRPVS